MRLIKGSRYIVENYGKEIIDRGLQNDKEIMELYDTIADSLYRVNGTQSVTCLGIWAVQRRRVRTTWFEQEVMQTVEEYPERYHTEHSEAFLEATWHLNSGYNQLDSVVDHLKEQNDNVHKYIWAGSKVFADLVHQNWEQHKAKKPVQPSAGRFYRKYYHSMRQWRWSIEDEAL